jgi:hypothetical protein
MTATRSGAPRLGWNTAGSLPYRCPNTTPKEPAGQRALALVAPGGSGRAGPRIGWPSGAKYRVPGSAAGGDRCGSRRCELVGRDGGGRRKPTGEASENAGGLPGICTAKSTCCPSCYRQAGRLTVKPSGGGLTKKLWSLAERRPGRNPPPTESASGRRARNLLPSLGPGTLTRNSGI